MLRLEGKKYILQWHYFFFMLPRFLPGECFAGITTVTGLRADHNGSDFVDNCNAGVVWGFGERFRAVIETIDNTYLRGRTIGLKVINESDDNQMDYDIACIDGFKQIGWMQPSGTTDAYSSMIWGIGMGWKGTFMKQCDGGGCDATWGANCPASMTGISPIIFNKATSCYWSDVNFQFYFKQLGKSIVLPFRMVMYCYITTAGGPVTYGTSYPSIITAASVSSTSSSNPVISTASISSAASSNWYVWTPTGYVSAPDQAIDWFDDTDPNEPYTTLSTCWPYAGITSDVNESSYYLYSYDSSNNVIDVSPIDVNSSGVSDYVTIVSDYKYKGVYYIGTTSTGVPGGKRICILGLPGGRIDTVNGSSNSHIINLVDFTLLSDLLWYDNENLAAFCDDYMTTEQ